MSQIKTTEIQGDLSVGRRLTAGGSVTVRGNAAIAKNLKVEGWLDAKNIKGPSKGLYATEQKLNEAYPEPKPGWWALVGSTLPAALYKSEGGAWVDTGEQAGNPTIDCEAYNEAVLAVESELIGVGEATDRNKSEIERINGEIAEIEAEADAKAKKIGEIEEAAAEDRERANKGILEANGRIDANIDAIKGLSARIGAAEEEMSESVRKGEEAHRKAEEGLQALAAAQAADAEELRKAAAAAADKAAAAAPKSVYFDELDTCGVEHPAYLTMAIGGAVPHTRYAVLQKDGDRDIVVGTLDVHSDDSLHSVKQVLETSYIFRNGKLAAHSDTQARRYCRAYVMRGESQSWGEWRPCEPPWEEVASEEAMERLVSQGMCDADTIYYTVEEE